MVKRIVKRRASNLARLLFYGIFGVLLIIFIFFGVRFLLPLISNTHSTGPDGKIIKPIAEQISANDIINKLADHDIILDSVNDASVSGSIVIKIKDGPLVYFSKNLDSGYQVSTLQLILARFTIDNKKVTFVDLRGSRPIVKFAGL